MGTSDHATSTVKEIKKKRGGKPLPRHQLLLKKISENLGKEQDASIAIGTAMRELGYSQSYSESPSQLRNTASWNALMEKHLSDDKLSAVHDRLLNLNRIVQLHFHYKLSDEEIKEEVERLGFSFLSTKRFMNTAVVFFSCPDGLTQKAALEMAYKLKGKFAPEEIDMRFAGYSKVQLIDFILGKTTPS